MRILAVDDDLITLKIVSATLTSVGHDVLTLRSGTEALERVDAVRPQMVILDVVMPGMDGYAVCRQLRNRDSTAQLPILMLTTQDSLEERIKGLEAGADDYMVKPFQPEELQARVKALLRRLPLAEESEGRRDCKTIAVFSLRGGSGVSVMAVNLAVSLAQIWEQPTVLADLSLTCGHSALLLNLALRRTWADLAAIPVAELDAEALQHVMLPHDSGVRVVASPKNPREGEQITVAHVARVLALLRERNDYLVLDLPHDFHETTLAGLDVAQQIVVMLPPELAAVYAMSRALDVFEGLGYPAQNILLALNGTFERDGLDGRDIEAALKRPVGAVIPFASAAIVASINKGAPVVLQAPNSPIGAALEDLAFLLSKEEHRQTPPSSPTAAWERIASRAKRRQRKGK
jgi:pilus assembly protein CpaE